LLNLKRFDTDTFVFPLSFLRAAPPAGAYLWCRPVDNGMGKPARGGSKKKSNVKGGVLAIKAAGVFSLNAW
jgi:hypothetical protein